MDLKELEVWKKSKDGVYIFFQIFMNLDYKIFIGKYISQTEETVSFEKPRN